jgi:hypothetical protein
MINRLAVEKMEEGRPMELSTFKRIEYSKECLQRKTAASHPLRRWFSTT